MPIRESEAVCAVEESLASMRLGRSWRGISATGPHQAKPWFLASLGM